MLRFLSRSAPAGRPAPASMPSADSTAPPAPPVEAVLHRVFISHSSKDRAFVKGQIIPVLKEFGIETWYSPWSIKTGQKWEREIRAGLQACDWFLVVMSQNATESEWVNREVHWADERRRGRIVTVKASPCEPTDVYLGLVTLQHIDYTIEPDEARGKLQEACRKIKDSPSLPDVIPLPDRPITRRPGVITAAALLCLLVPVKTQVLDRLIPGPRVAKEFYTDSASAVRALLEARSTGDYRALDYSLPCPVQWKGIVNPDPYPFGENGPSVVLQIKYFDKAANKETRFNAQFHFPVGQKFPPHMKAGSEAELKGTLDSFFKLTSSYSLSNSAIISCKPAPSRPGLDERDSH